MLIACSGGADSVALVRALVALFEEFSDTNESICERKINVAHFNHQWRGAESDGDERFVRDLCHAWQLPLTVGTAEDTKSAAQRSEEAAREARYKFLTETAYQVGARYVVTAHTASDRIETMLHNMFRGSGLAGVSRPALFSELSDELLLVRPMLGCFRTDVEANLRELTQAYRTDSSNADQRFRRNFIRQSVLPMIRGTYGKQVDERLLAFSNIAEESLELQRRLALRYLDEIAKHESAPERRPEDGAASVELPGEGIVREDWIIVREAIDLEWQKCGWAKQAMSRDHWLQIRSAWELTRQDELSAEDAIHANLPDDIQLVLRQGWIVLRKTPLR